MLAILFCFLSPLSHGQYDGDDVYDPFADYSEFEESSQEEADINFFRNGRFFNVGLLVGGRIFTGGMAEAYDADLAPGLSLTFFFNLRLALQFSYVYSQHILTIVNPAVTYQGNVSITSLAFDLKYYFNTSNVTRGLADLNPYILAGFSQNSRNTSLVTETVIGKDDGPGLNMGVGIEIPVARNEMFIGAQFVYTYVNFANENNPVPGTDPQFFLAGDMFQSFLILGFNFL